MDSTEMYLNLSPESLLASRGDSYQPVEFNYSLTMSRARPIINFWSIAEMVMDPRVMFGLLLLKGPIIANTRFKVLCEEEEIADFAIKQINKFWNRCIGKVLEGIEWGYSSSETLYELDEDRKLVLKGMNTFKAQDVRVVLKRGIRCGIKVDNVKTYGYGSNGIYLGGPKHFHYVHWRKHDKHYGRSRLFATVIPWWEMWAKSGYRDIRRLWFGKNAYNGGMVRYPIGTTNVPGRGPVDNHALALELASKLMTGGVAVAPSTRTGQLRDGEYDWMFEPVKPNSVPAGLMEYGALLRIEVLESMGIPYEVVESSGNEGFGSSSGRSIPLTVYNSILFEIVQDIMNDFREQILEPLIWINWKKKVDLDILPMPLQTPEQEMNNPNISEEEDDKQGLKDASPEAQDSAGKKKKTQEEDTESDTDSEDSEEMTVATR